MLEYAFAARKISHIFHFPYITQQSSTVGIKFIPKRFDMIIISLFFKLFLSQLKIYLFDYTFRIYIDVVHLQKHTKYIVSQKILQLKNNE